MKTADVAFNPPEEYVNNGACVAPAFCLHKQIYVSDINHPLVKPFVRLALTQ